MSTALNSVQAAELTHQAVESKNSSFAELVTKVLRRKPELSPFQRCTIRCCLNVQGRVCPDIVERGSMRLLDVRFNKCRFLAINDTCHITLEIEHARSQIFNSVRVHKALHCDIVSWGSPAGCAETHDDGPTSIKALQLRNESFPPRIRSMCQEGINQHHTTQPGHLATSCWQTGTTYLFSASAVSGVPSRLTTVSKRPGSLRISSKTTSNP